MTLLSKLMNPSARPRATRKPSMLSYSAIAEMAGNLRFSSDVPVRFQREWLVLFSAGVVFLALIAGLYLNVTARAAISGREIQNLEAQISANQRVNADLKTQIAILLSNNTLHKRATEAGFETVSTENLEYMVVPGYFPSQGVKLVTPENNTDVLSVSPEFSESLFDWVARQMKNAATPLGQVP